MSFSDGKDLPLNVEPWLADASRLVEQVPKDAKRLLLIGRNLWELALIIKQFRPQITILTLVDSLSLRQQGQQEAEKRGYSNLEVSFRNQNLDAFKRSIRDCRVIDRYDVVVLAPIPHKSPLCRDTAGGIMRLISVAPVTMTPEGTLIVLDRMYPYEYLTAPCPERITDKILVSAHQRSFFEYMEALVDNPYISSRYIERDQYSLCNVVQFLLASSDISFDPTLTCMHRCQAVPEHTYEDLIKVLRMKIVHKEIYTTPLFQKTLRREFCFTNSEVESLLSTGLYVAKY